MNKNQEKIVQTKELFTNLKAKTFIQLPHQPLSCKFPRGRDFTCFIHSCSTTTTTTLPALTQCLAYSRNKFNECTFYSNQESAPCVCECGWACVHMCASGRVCICVRVWVGVWACVCGAGGCACVCLQCNPHVRAPVYVHLCRYIKMSANMHYFQ